MKKKNTISFIIAVLLVMTVLSACGKPDATTEASNQTATVTDSGNSMSEVEQTKVEADEQFEEDDSQTSDKETATESLSAVFPGETKLTEEVFDYLASEDWQKAYRQLLDDTFIDENNPGYSDYYLQSYGIYDVDKDGIPELLITTGTCEADYVTSVYCYIDGQVKALSELGSGHTQFYTYPDDNGIIQYIAHMGYGYAVRYTLKDGELIEDEDALLEDDLNERLQVDADAEYVSVSSVVEGAIPIGSCSLLYTYGLLGYESRIVTDSEISHDNFVKRIDAITSLKDSFFAVYPMEYWNNSSILSNGEKTLIQIYDDPSLLGSTNGERVIKDLYYGDFDNDGYEECLAVLEEGEYENKLLILFTYQNGRIYGYISNIIFHAEIEIEDDQIYACQDYYIQKFAFNYCMNQCVINTYLVDKAPLSETAKDTLESFRQDLRTDKGELGVLFMGCTGNLSGLSMSQLIKQTGEKYADETFLTELDRCTKILQPGEEVYLLIPASSKYTISVYEVIWGEQTADGMPQRGELLYQAEQGEMVIVRGNQSDIVSNIEVSMRANGQDLIYSPSLSLENGRVQTQNKVVDITRWN